VVPEQRLFIGSLALAECFGTRMRVLASGDRTLARFRGAALASIEKKADRITA
jgi:hypothetical protein